MKETGRERNRESMGGRQRKKELGNPWGETERERIRKPMEIRLEKL